MIARPVALKSPVVALLPEKDLVGVLTPRHDLQDGAFVVDVLCTHRGSVLFAKRQRAFVRFEMRLELAQRDVLGFALFAHVRELVFPRALHQDGRVLPVVQVVVACFRVRREVRVLLQPG